MIKQIIRLFPGFKYGLRRNTLIMPQHIVGQIDNVFTFEDARNLLDSLVMDGYLEYKQSEPSKLGSTMAGWILSDKGWQIYVSI